MIFDGLMNINTPEEMDEYLNTYTDGVFTLLDQLRQEDIKYQMIKKIVSTSTPEFLYDVIIFVCNQLDDTYLAFDFLHEAYRIQREVFNQFFTNNPDSIYNFYRKFRFKEGFNDIFKEFTDEQKANILKQISSLDEKEMKNFFSSNEELLSFFTNIPEEEAIAIGNGYDDICMTDVVGTSVAMGNSVERLKEAATYITKDASEDGVASILEKLCLEGE